MRYHVIVGHRLYPYAEHVKELVRRLPRDTIVVSGGALGPEAWAEREAIKLGLPTSVVFKPVLPSGRLISSFSGSWLQACFTRNQKLLEFAVQHRELLLPIDGGVVSVFCLPDTPGHMADTRDVIKRAAALRLSLTRHYPNGRTVQD